MFCTIYLSVYKEQQHLNIWTVWPGKHWMSRPLCEFPVVLSSCDAGGFLGHPGSDAGLLHLHQQEGLWIIQSIKEQISGCESQNQGKGLCGGGGVLHLLCPLPLHTRPIHSDTDWQHGEWLLGTERSLYCKGNNPVAVSHQCVSGSTDIRVPVQRLSSKTDGHTLP